tara:strand:+ start:170 stop:688 length:519 start_codon:yes stop_codon:yes gene_type:complete
MIVTFKMGLKAFINGHGRTTMAQNGGGKGWQWDEETGEKIMPKKWQKLLDWLLQGPDRVPKYQKDWAAENKISPDSIRRIKRDPRFAKEWDRRAAELNIHPERTQSVIDALHAQAVSGSTQAASLYLQYIEKFTPRRKILVEDRDAAGMSDDELADELEAQIHHLRVVDGEG